MKPSDFCIFPTTSVLQNYESELVGLNIMIILKRTGNRFRPLPWNEYKKEREKDGGSIPNEHSLFDDVIKYCKNADTARSFSPEWEKV